MSFGLPLWFWLAIAWLTVAYLALLGTLALVRPAKAFGFLSGFARTPLVNASEAVARALVGLSLINLGGELGWGGAGNLLGLFLLGTACLMLLFPVQHRRLAPRLVQSIEPFMTPFGLASLLLAGAFAYCLLRD